MNVLSFDIEEIFQGEFTRKLVGLKRIYRSQENIGSILDLLQQYQTKATFFIVGECIPDDSVLSELARKGHEIAFHTQDHIPLWEKNASTFRAELADFKRRVSEVTGTDCIGFRAPSFSLDRSTSWAIQCLKVEGFKYDSSVFPVFGPLYGLPSAPLKSYELSTIDPASEGDSGIIEFPLTVVEILGLRIPVAGGFYLRAIPQSIMNRLLDRALRVNGSLIIYSHNWEVDARVEPLPFTPGVDFYCYFNIASTLDKLQRLLGKYRFGRFADALEWRRQKTLTKKAAS